ncbi:H-2 class II histocompatibility antigen, E-S beta chain-like [Genypterus blacodes]|uniref:H-2 class II histocompatibility antigen, E-S beta chain-like n=1 Tax=Genypterus blacodes TaxID=154954 RepID=UPI003F762F18
MSSLSLFSILLLCLLCSRVGGHFGHGMIRCQFTSRDGSDAVYLEQYFFNKLFLGQYNSTLRKWTAATPKAVDIVAQLNKNPSLLEQMQKNTNICIDSIPLLHNYLLTPAEPYVRLRSAEASSSRHPGILICSVYNFYPKQIRVTWLKNGKEVTSDVTSTEELPNGNWFYQIHSHLEYTPKPGEKISCMVEHASLTEPKLYHWEPTNEEVRNKMAVGTAGFVLGLIFSIAGLIYYMRSCKRVSGRSLVPTHITE